MRILVTAAGSPGFLTLFKSLSEYQKNLEIFICDSNSESFNLKLFKNSFQAHPADSSEYISQILNFCNSNLIDVVIPSSDEEVRSLGRNIKKFKECGIKVLSTSSNLESIFNKKLFFERVRDHFPEIVPDFIEVKNSKEFEEAYSLLSKRNEKLCVKPAIAHGSRGFKVIQNSSLNLEDFFSKKPNPHEISYKELLSTLSQKEEFPSLLLMEYMPGDEYSIDCLETSAGFLSVSRRRDTIKEGICSSGEAIKKEDLQKYSKLLYDLFQIEYNANFQFRYDKNGRPKIIELNPRFSGTMELCRGAGVDFAKLALDKLLEKKCESLPEIKWGTKMQRVWEEVFTHNGKTFVLESVGSILERKNV